MNDIVDVSATAAATIISTLAIANLFIINQKTVEEYRNDRSRWSIRA